MTYKGLIDSSAALPKNASTGDTYVLSADDASADFEVGDMFIFNGKTYDRVPSGDTPITDKDATLAFGAKSTIAEVEGVEIHVTMPSETALNVTAGAGTSGLTYVSAVEKGANSHDLTVKTSTIQDGTTAQKGVLKLVDSSVSTSVVDAVTPNALKTVNDLAKDKSKVTYSQTVKSTTNSSYEIGKITIDGTTTILYGHDKDTVYTHPTAPTTGNAMTGTAGDTSAKTVVTGISRDTTGHISGFTTSDISDAYKMRAVSVNGTQQLSATSALALDISAGSNITAEFKNNKVVISAASGTDEKVKAEASESKSYLLGQLTNQAGTANHATYDTDVYIQAGTLHATSLYEGAWSVHDSSAGDWGTIQ